MRRLRWFLICLIGAGCLATQATQRDVFWALLGEYPEEARFNPYKVTRDDKSVDSAAILYAVRRAPGSVAEIAAQSGLTREVVVRKLGELETCGLVRREQDRYAINFPFWDAPLRDEIVRLGQQLADSAVRILDEELPGLKAAFAQSSLPGQGYAWKDLSLTIVGGLLLDTGLNDRGIRKRRLFVSSRDTPVRPGGYTYWYRAVEGGWGPFYKFGHNLTNLDGGWFGLFYGQLPGEKMAWSQVWDVHDKKGKQVLRVLIREGRVGQEELAGKAGLPRSELRTILEAMRQKGVVKILDSWVEPGFPVLDQSDLEILLDRVDAICERIIREVYDPALPVILERWKELAPRAWEIDKVDKIFLRDVYDRPYNLVLDRLIRRGTLPPPPAKPPFAYWAINGEFEVL